MENQEKRNEGDRPNHTKLETAVLEFANEIDCAVQVFKVQRYIAEEGNGGLIDVDDLVMAIGGTRESVEENLKSLEAIGEISLIVRYHCPEAHYIRSVPVDNKIECEQCDYCYPLPSVNVKTYIKKQQQCNW